MRPNLLVILSDQLRRHALGCYGNRDVATPAIDNLARRGVRFQNACSTSPICVPFRFTFMTGEYAHSRCVPGIEWRMSPSERTLADEFNDAGYDTIYVGKWHLYGGHGRPPFSNAPRCGHTRIPREHQGRWKKWLGFELRNDPFDTWYFEDDDPTPRKIETYQTDGLCDLAMEQLRRRGKNDKPFACVISVEPPHDPYVAPAPLMERWRERSFELLPNFSARNEDERKRFMTHHRYYNACVENLDHNVGRVTAFLEESGLAKNTIVVFLSDHGDLLGSHGLGQKQYPYEESIGTPLIVVNPICPGSAGRVVEEPTCTEDLFPTLLGLAGLQPRDRKCGIDLAPLARGETKSLPREGVYLEFVAELRDSMPFCDKTWRGFRTKDAIYTTLGDLGGADPWHFFDLRGDPFQLRNLVGDPAHAAEVGRLHGLLREAAIRTGDHYALKPAFGHEGWNVPRCG